MAGTRARTVQSTPEVLGQLEAVHDPDKKEALSRDFKSEQSLSMCSLF